jgi:hypothetical protein
VKRPAPVFTNRLRELAVHRPCRFSGRRGRKLPAHYQALPPSLGSAGCWVGAGGEAGRQTSGGGARGPDHSPPISCTRYRSRLTVSSAHSGPPASRETKSMKGPATLSGTAGSTTLNQYQPGLPGGSRVHTIIPEFALPARGGRDAKATQEGGTDVAEGKAEARRTLRKDVASPRGKPRVFGQDDAKCYRPAPPARMRNVPGRSSGRAPASGAPAPPAKVKYRRPVTPGCPPGGC